MTVSPLDARVNAVWMFRRGALAVPELASFPDIETQRGPADLAAVVKLTIDPLDVPLLFCPTAR